MPRWPTLVNGVFSEQLSVADRGLQYGDGLFETMLLRRGRILLLDLHLDRLAQGLRRLRIDMSRERIERELRLFLSNCSLPDSAVIKIIATRGESARGYRPPAQAPATLIVRMLEHQELPAGLVTEGVALRICQMRLAQNPALAGLKHLNRLEQVLARSEWRDEVFEGLMLDHDGFIICGTMSNLFICKENVIITPALTGCGINGVVRRYIIESLAPSLDIPLLQQRVSLEDVSQADEVWISNSLIHILPVYTCENMQFNVGPVSKALRAALYANLGC